RQSEVIHPPVAVDRFHPSRERDDFILVAGAFAPYKRAELAIEACRMLRRRLVGVGSGQGGHRPGPPAGAGVEVRGWVDDEEMSRLYRSARMLVFPGEEDFGIIPVEAMASGCPVVAYGRGGAVETVGAGATTEALDRVARGGAAVVPGGVLFGEQ